MLSIQKKLARRTPRVTGSTRCTLVPGYSTMSPAGELDALRAEGVLDHQLAAVVLVGLAQEQRAAHVGAHPLAWPPGRKRTALSTWLPNALALPA